MTSPSKLTLFLPTSQFSHPNYLVSSLGTSNPQFSFFPLFIGFFSGLVMIAFHGFFAQVGPFQIILNRRGPIMEIGMSALGLMMKVGWCLTATSPKAQLGCLGADSEQHQTPRLGWSTLLWAEQYELSPMNDPFLTFSLWAI